MTISANDSGENSRERSIFKLPEKDKDESAQCHESECLEDLGTSLSTEKELLTSTSRI